MASFDEQNFNHNAVLEYLKGIEKLKENNPTLYETHPENQNPTTAPNFKNIFNVESDKIFKIKHNIKFEINDYYKLSKFEKNSKVYYIFDKLEDNYNINTETDIIFLIVSVKSEDILQFINTKQEYHLILQIKYLDTGRLKYTKVINKKSIIDLLGNDNRYINSVFNLTYELEGQYIPTSDANLVMIRPTPFENPEIKDNLYYAIMVNGEKKIQHIYDDTFHIIVDCSKTSNCQPITTGGKKRKTKHKKRPRRKTRKNAPKK